MANYIGTRCIVCNEKFKDDDDIVVCPECGTPYHRECYKKEGKCVNTALHESHRSWTPSYDVGDSSASFTENVVCSKCGCINPPMTLFCEKCGNPLSTLEQHNEDMRVHTAPLHDDSNPDEYNKNFNGQIPFGVNVQPFMINFSDPLCGYNPDEDFDGVRLCELGDYVESNTHYYLPIFKRIKETGRALTWNFTAMLFPEFYFAYRKMPLISLAAFIVRLFALAPIFITVLSQGNIGVLSEIAKGFDIRSTAFQILNILSYVLTYGIMFFCGGFANWIYYKHAVKQTAKIKAASAPQNLRNNLRRKGGTSAVWLVIAILVFILPYTIVYMYSFASVFGGFSV